MSEELKARTKRLRQRLRRTRADLNRARAGTETGGVFRHKKSGQLFRVVHDDALMRGTAEPLVVYRSILGGRPWVAPRSEFLENWEAEPE